MKTASKAIASSLIVGLLGLTSALPAQAQSFSYGQRDRVISTYCDRNPRDRDCNDFRRGHWERSDYDRFYGRHRSGLDSVASGVFGFTFGAILGSALANSNNGNNDRVVGRVGTTSHVDACYDRYRSYDARTDTYLGYDGARHACRL